MSKDIVTVEGTLSAFDAAKIMLQRNVDYLIVLEKAQPAGIVTERDLVLKVMAKGEDPLKMRVSECMSAPIVTTDPDAAIEEAVKIMAKHGIRRLPVVRDTIIYGVFTSQDLAKNFNKYEGKLAREIIFSFWRKF
jgi:CBS domain-containing protein